jgi:hypothetical protein
MSLTLTRPAVNMRIIRTACTGLPLFLRILFGDLAFEAFGKTEGGVPMRPMLSAGNLIPTRPLRTKHILPIQSRPFSELLIRPSPLIQQFPTAGLDSWTTL